MHMGINGQTPNHSDNSDRDEADHSNRVDNDEVDPRNIIVSIDVRNSKAASLLENGDIDYFPVVTDLCDSGDTTQTAHSSDAHCDSPMTLTHADSCVFSTLMENNDATSEWQHNIHREQGLETPPPFDFDNMKMVHAGRADCVCVSCSLAKSDSLCSHYEDSNNILYSLTQDASDRNLLNNDGGAGVKNEVPHSVASFAGSNASNSGTFEHRENMDVVHDDEDESSKAGSEMNTGGSGKSRTSGQRAERTLSGADEDKDFEVVFTGPRACRGYAVSLEDTAYLNEHINLEGIYGAENAQICTNVEVKIESDSTKGGESEQLFQLGATDSPPLPNGEQVDDGDEDESYPFHAVPELESSRHRFDESSDEGVDLLSDQAGVGRSALSDLFS